MTTLSPGTGSNSEVIDAPRTTFTWAAGYSAAIVAGLSGVLAVLQGLNVLDITEPVKIACIGLVGAGVLAWAIASAGDSFARAYALAHVTRTEEDKPNQPAILMATAKLAEVYAAANPAVDVQKAAAQTLLCPFPAPLSVKAQNKNARATAVLVSGESGKGQQRYLVGFPDSKLEWVDGDEIYLP